ncbi:unnamed protein product [Cuscuta europaea]|uniref:Uncharacterized protein n=1 Tax=Cuscuta europaea TaxID=41803 RepID=A0A9P0ZIS5_CUSEU|nr:unnamed protein product [Cuscuta europaea]
MSWLREYSLFFLWRQMM